MLTKPVSYTDRLRAAIEQGGPDDNDASANLDGVISLNSSMFDASIGDMSSLTGVGSELGPNDKIIVETEQAEEEQDGETKRPQEELEGERTSSGFGSLLEAGTMFAGVVGIALILATGGGGTKKESKKESKKEKASWLAKDW